MLGLDSKQLFWLIVIAILVVAYLIQDYVSSRYIKAAREDDTYKTIRLRELDVEVLKAGGTLPVSEEEEEYGHA